MQKADAPRQKPNQHAAARLLGRRPSDFALLNGQEMRLTRINGNHDSSAQLLLPNGRAIYVRIEDVSISGCKVQCSEVLPIGEAVILKAGNEEVAAEVRWSFEGIASLVLKDSF